MMTDVHAVVIAELRRIAPEADPATLDRNGEIRDQLDIDSMDFLNLVTALSKCLGTPIPERDYPHLRTLGAMESYLEARLLEKEKRL